MKNIKLLSFILFTSLALASCMGSPTGSPTVGGGFSGAGIQGAPQDNGQTDNTSAESNTSNPAGAPDAPGAQAPNALPVSSIPLSYLTKPLAYNTDSQGYTPVIGQAGTVEQQYSAGQHFVAVSTNPIENNTASLRVYPKTLLSTNYVIAQAQANTFAPNVNLNLPEDSICSQSGITCCPVKQDGSFECYPFSSNEKFYTAITDGSNVLAQAEPLNQNHYIRWFRQVPKDLASGEDGENIYSLTNDIGVKMTNIDGELRVNGDHKKDYSETTLPGAEQLIYNAADSRLGYLAPNGGIGLMNNILNQDLNDWFLKSAGDLVTVDNVKEYTVVKSINDKIWFGVEYADNIDVQAFKPSIYNPEQPGPIVCNNIDVGADCPEKHFWKIDINQNIPFPKRTINFEITEDNGNPSFSYSLVVYSDPQNNVHLLQNNFKTDSPSIADINDTTSDSIKDLQIYHADNGPQDHGRALILDSDKNRLLFADFNYKDIKANRSVSIPYQLGMGAIPKKPVDIVLIKNNNEASFAYVLNQADDTLTKIKLQETTSGKPERVGHIDLKDVSGLVDKIDKLIPTSMSLFNNNDHSVLIVACTNLKGSLVLDMRTLDDKLVKDEAVAQDYSNQGALPQKINPPMVNNILQGGVLKIDKNTLNILQGIRQNNSKATSNTRIQQNNTQKTNLEALPDDY